MNLANQLPVITLTTKLYQNGKFSFSRMHVLLIYYFKLGTSVFFSLILELLYGRKIRRTALSQPPVFILGHFRSGTTYLHKLMVAGNGLGYISNYDILCPNLSMLLGNRFGKLLQRVLEFLKIKNYHFNNSIHQLFDPGEEDMYLISSGSDVAAYWGFIFPNNQENLFITDHVNDAKLSRWKWKYLFALKYATLRNNGKRLVLKNPPNTGRIPLLLEMFPDAKFIYIHRNPFDLYYSMNNLWTKVISRYYSLQDTSPAEIENFIYNYYSRLTASYERDKGLIPSGNLVEVSFNNLECEPFETVRDIFTKLNLPVFEKIEPALREKIQKETAYKKFTYTYDEKVLDRTEKTWYNEILKYSYLRPTSSSV